MKHHSGEGKRGILDKEKIARVKAATVAIGFAEEGDAVPREVIGTGFFVNDDGIVMTAAHVKRACAMLEAKKITTGSKERVVAFTTTVDNNGLFFIASRLESGIEIGHDEPRPPGTIIPQDLDVGLLKLKPNRRITKYPYLKIKQPSRLELYEEILMTGYPAGTQTLNFDVNSYRGMRISPVVQFGKTVGIIPYDEARVANAIQTDIISTGGSSGSPIVSVKTGEVIAMAQEVIGSTVLVGQQSFPVKVGAVYGISNQVLYVVAQEANQMFTPGYVPKLNFDATRFPKVSRIDL